VTTNTDFGSLLRWVATEDGPAATEKSISENTGVPCVPGGSAGWKVDNRRVLDDDDDGKWCSRMGRARHRPIGRHGLIWFLELRKANAAQVLIKVL
jgi:hypothetical protein